MKAKNLSGQRFGRLTAMSVQSKRVNGKSRRFWKCACDCGRTIEVISTSIMSGGAKSCGCLKIDSLSTHRKSKSPEYRAWAGMIQRCTNPNSSRFASYGGRGISVSEDWLSFEQFFADIGYRPGPEYSIDRIDNNKGYSKSNCKWSTRSEQQRNKRPYDPSNLPHGDDHWTRKDGARARRVAQENIKNAHGSGEANGNAKLDVRTAHLMREHYRRNPRLTMKELGGKFGVGRETARKVTRGLLWFS